MNRDHDFLNKVFASIAFLGALIIYFLTMPPTTSFWDCAERIACSNLLQIPHPPGTPFYLLLGRLFSMFMPSEYVGYSINMMSTLASSFTILFLYLISVRLIREFKGHPDTYDQYDKIALYLGSLIGAFSFAFSISFWFTAVEAETYALSLTFTAFSFWLVLKWSENHERNGNERWLVFIAYVYGLAFGVHLLSLLSIFAITLIVYFKKYTFSWKSFLITSGISVLLFFSIYPIIIIQLPTLAGNFSNLTGGVLGAVGFFVILMLVILYALYYTHTRNYRIANIALLAYTCILIGYSTYTLIYVRSSVNPPIDQNSPDTVQDFISYLKREQYGQTPLLTGYTYNNDLGNIDRSSETLFPRRHSREPRHLQKYAQYSSDFDYFVRYQLGFMYFRYFAWNFIGRDSDFQDATWVSGFRPSANSDNPGHNTYFFLPLILGLIGMFYHFQKDWKRALTVMVLFLATGVAIVLYLNQFPFQPRERDYSYTGSFFAFSIWMGIGASGMLFMLKELYNNKIMAYISAITLAIAVPFWMGVQNWHDSDRSSHYIAPDYAYNMLNSVAPYGIIFTNGDNDTFPLWYLQDVEGIRRDVRVVNLSLLNTTWYILQMKNKWNYEAPPVPISLTDDQIKNIEDKFFFQRPGDFWRPQEVVIPVNKPDLTLFYEQGRGLHSDVIQSEYFVDVFKNASGEIIHAPAMSFDIPVNELDDNVRWFYQGNFLGADRDGNELYYTRIQDDIVMDILRTNNWKRPIYFAITVSQDGQINLQNYFRLEGKAFRVVPKRHNDDFGIVDPVIHGNRLRTFRLREIDNEDAYFDENIRRMVDNYRTIITRQATTWQDLGEPDSALVWLKWGEEKIPFTSIQGDDMTSMVTYAYRYAQLGELDRANHLGDMAIDKLMKNMSNHVTMIDKLDMRMEQLERDIQINRANLEKRRGLERLRRNIALQRDAVIREISFDSSRFIIIQRIMYLSGRDDDAFNLYTMVTSTSGNRIPFPSSKEDNERQVRRIFSD